MAKSVYLLSKPGFLKFRTVKKLSSALKIIGGSSVNLGPFLRKSVFNLIFAWACLWSGLAHAATWQVLGGSISVDVPPGPTTSGGSYFSMLTPTSPGLMVDGTYSDYMASEIFTSVTPPADIFYYYYPMYFNLGGIGVPTPTISVDLANGTADMSAFWVSWYETPLFSTLGPASITAQGDGTYILNWDMSGGITVDQTTHMTIHIAPAAVPVPAAVWLFGSGLAALLGFSRRKIA